MRKVLSLKSGGGIEMTTTKELTMGEKIWGELTEIIDEINEDDSQSNQED